METIKARDDDELLQKLRANHAPVPLRGTNGQTTKRRETWTTCHILAAICKETTLLEYPLQVEHKDCPDIRLFMRSESVKVGVEVVEAVPPERARMQAYAEREGIDIYSTLDVSGRKSLSKKSLSEQKKKKTKEEIRRKESQVRPWMGDSVERKWVEGMMKISKSKAEKFQRKDFSKYKYNWLFVYDGLPGWGSGLEKDMEKAVARLNEKLFNKEWENPFDRIFVLTFSASTVLEFCKKLLVPSLAKTQGDI